MTIEFGDWQLRRKDELNYELYHKRQTATNSMTVKNGTAGKMRWHATGHYYQTSTFALALEYAAGWELRNEHEGTVSVSEYISELARVLREHRAAFAAVFSG